jgi:UDP-glucuronate decarboxylase
MRKRVLVTDGAGFLGSYLCARLLRQDCDVLCGDNYCINTRHNIEPLGDNPGFEVIRHDITFPLYVEVEEIYNLAYQASPIGPHGLFGRRAPGGKTGPRRGLPRGPRKKGRN